MILTVQGCHCPSAFCMHALTLAGHLCSYCNPSTHGQGPPAFHLMGLEGGDCWYQTLGVAGKEWEGLACVYLW